MCPRYQIIIYICIDDITLINGFQWLIINVHNKNTVTVFAIILQTIISFPEPFRVKTSKTFHFSVARMCKWLFLRDCEFLLVCVCVWGILFFVISKVCF